MRVRSQLNVVSRLGSIPEAQHGYFSRAQAAERGVEDLELARAVSYRQIHRLGRVDLQAALGRRYDLEVVLELADKIGAW